MHNLRENRVVVRYRCLDCDQSEEFHAAGRRLTENRAESAHAHRLLIEDRREIVLCALASTCGHPPARIVADDHVPRRFSSGQRQVCRTPARAVVRERVRRVQDALENATFSWNDRRHTTDYRLARPQAAARMFACQCS